MWGGDGVAPALLASQVLGGGRIEMDSRRKSIHVFGHSYGFPWRGGVFRHDLTQAVCRRAYPDFEVTTSNDGY